MGRRRHEQKNADGLILKLRMIVAVQNRFLLANFSAPSLLASAPSLVCSGDGTESDSEVARL